MASREELIALCEKAIIPLNKWRNRDTPEGQAQLGICWAYLKAGCDFKADEGIYFVILNIFHPTFNTIERQEGLGGPELEESSFYIPTQRQLDRKKGGDWH